MIGTLAIIILFGIASGCPETVFPPCTCRLIGNHSRIITCSGAENEIDLQRSLQFMKNSPLPIRSVKILDSVLNYIPSKAFKGLEFPRLFIAGSSMSSLSDSEHVGFVGLENCLETLIVDDCEIYSGWSWTHLKNLKSLKELSTIKAGHLEVDDDVKEIAHLNLTYLLLTQDSISRLHDTAFSTFHNLQTLSLKRNEIKELKRSMFPNPANSLQQLIFSFNQLETIPKDLFTDMPELVTINFSNNRIMSLDKFTFLPVWGHLMKFDFADNPLRCDCRLKWIVDHPFPLNTWSTCDEPQILKGKKIQELDKGTLWC